MYKNGKNIIFTDRSTDSADMFLRNIRQSEPLTTAQEYQLWQRMRQGDMRARSQLIYANLRYVVVIAKKYLASGASFDDLLMAGSLGITRAADMFDATLGNRFISFATWYIENEVRKTAYDHLRHTSTSLDEPLHNDQPDAGTRGSNLPTTAESSPDWHLRYHHTLDAVRSRLDKHYWQGTGDMLADYLAMLGKGYTAGDFARKHHLDNQQMKRFLDMVGTESRQLLKTVA